MEQSVVCRDGRYWKPCANCGEMQSYLRRNYAVESLRLGRWCKGCRNKLPKANRDRGNHRGIRFAWFNKLRTNAETRGLEFDLTIDDLAELFIAQDGKCALTGWAIRLPMRTNDTHRSVMSVDRIDSSKGYTGSNIQLVCKDVNMMKQKYDQDYFVDVCKAVADRVKW